MWSYGAESGIIRRCDHVATLQHFIQSLNRLEEDACQRGRAFWNDACSWMGPRDDWTALRRCWSTGDDHHPRDGDRLALQSFGSVENAIRNRVIWRAVERLCSDQPSI